MTRGRKLLQVVSQGVLVCVCLGGAPLEKVAAENIDRKTLGNDESSSVY